MGGACISSAVAATNNPAKRSISDALIDALSDLDADPYQFVLDMFPWGEPGALEDETGPDEWQVDILKAVRDGLLSVSQAVKVAVASGHGVGKSALVAWLILWAFTTRADTKGVVTANTETQLKTKTWAELAKWFGLFEARRLFRLTATAIFSRDKDHAQTWRIDQIAWSEKTMEAFAGLHNKGKRIIVVFDEASAIPDLIWETTEGALTDKDTEIMWFVFGNPTRNTGRFRECFGRFLHRWLTRQVDGRTAKITNKAQIQEWIDDYGEDSDFVRVRVRGVFPRAGSMQFISSDVVELARKREAASDVYDPLIIGVDVARFGDDQTVIKARKGRDGRTFPAIKLRSLDTMQVAARVFAYAQELRADAVFVDEGGVGGGVVDRLRQMRLPGLIGIDFGSKSDDPIIGADGGKFAFKVDEIWSKMKAWLKFGAIEDANTLVADLTGREYGYDLRNAIRLETKKEMKKRGLSSPDEADALALTFAYSVAANPQAGGTHGGGGTTIMAGIDDDPFA